MSAILEWVRNYFDMGVPVCWILDPATLTGWVSTPGHLEESNVLRAGVIEMPLSEIFA